MGDDTALPPLAGRARPALLVLPPALRAGDESADRPPARAAHVLLRRSSAARAPLLTEGPESARGDGVRELLPLSRTCSTSALNRARRDFEADLESALPCGSPTRREAFVRAGRTALLVSDTDRGPGVDPGAARRRRRPPAARRARAALAGDDRRRDRRGARGTPHRLPARLRRRGDLPAARARDGRGAGRGGQARRRPSLAGRGAGALPGGDRGRRAEDHVQDGHRRRRRLLRRAGLRRARSRAGGGRPLLRRHARAVGGIGFAELEREALGAVRVARELENPGYVKFRKGGEPHETDASGGRRGACAAAAPSANDRPGGVRPLRRARRRPRADGAPRPARVRARASRFRSTRSSRPSRSSGASRPAACRTARSRPRRTRRSRPRSTGFGARSNCGEGGEDPARFRTERNSRIKQIASGRFGVTPEYAAFADELQIKIAQGSKPGEGGQLPGHKVTAEIARLRHTTPGVALISPPPHHDIYSIEDLAQLIFDLRQVNPDAAISVKLVAETGVGLVASWRRQGARRRRPRRRLGRRHGREPALVDQERRRCPGSSASPRRSSSLVANGLRGRVRLRADGGIKTGRDVVVAALLGADEISFGTALLLAEGCLMVRSCHLDTCPVGIATQRPELRAKYRGDAGAGRGLPALRRRRRAALARLTRAPLPRGGGRPHGPPAPARRRAIRVRTRSTSRRCWGRRRGRYEAEPMPVAGGGELGERLAADAEPALEGPALVEPSYPISHVGPIGRRPARRHDRRAVRLADAAGPGPRAVRRALPARASARSSPPASSSTWPARRTTTSGRRWAAAGS